MMESNKAKATSQLSQSMRRLKKNRRAMTALASIIIMVLIAVFAPLIAPYDPNELHYDSILQPPSRTFPLGTDEQGRDICSRIIYGARVSLSIGLITQFISLVLGVIMGTLAGYYGGIVDMLISRLMEILASFPNILFALAIMSILGHGIFNLFIALGLLGWVGKARVVRGQIFQLKEREFVEASRACGAPPFWIMIKHLIPSCVPMLIVQVSMGIPGSIMSEVGLSYLGLGVQPPTPSWGSMIQGARPYMRARPTYAIFPGLAIMVVIFAFNIFGDCLRDVLDPRLRESQ